MRVLSLILLLVAVAGCERVKTHQVVDAGPVCGENEHLVNGTCRFVCNRDGDCQTGERCNLLFGACEPKPPPVDAGPDLTPCTEGAVRCSADATTLQSCSDAGVFVTSEVCAQPDGYCENEQCLACRPGTRRCGADTTTAEVCLDDGSAWRTITCAATAACVDGECDECTLGDRRCNATNDTVEECERTTDETRATAYAPAGDNFDGTCITRQCETGVNGPQCHPPACVPGALACASSTVQQSCGATGAWVQTDCVAMLDAGTAECVSGVCLDECADAVAAHSYFGCDYWSMIPDNSVDTLFKGRLTGGVGTGDSDFVYVVTNQSIAPATVTVRRFNGSSVVTVKTVTVPGKNDPATRGLVKIAVPWFSISPSTVDVGDSNSGLSRIAYRLSSTKPVTVYQFNPVDASHISNKTCTAAVGTTTCTCNEYDGYDSISCALGSQNPGTCVQTSSGKRCSYNSYSNDASLLLPAHILGTSYVALTPDHSTWAGTPSPGVYSIVASQDGTTVHVASTAITKAGTGVVAMAVDGGYDFTLNSYDVLQVASANGGTNAECTTLSGSNQLCRTNNDPTGSIITTNKPVAVFASSSCYQAPYNWTACDHVEEMLFPFDTWGKNFVAVPSNPLRLKDNTIPSANQKPDQFKIVAGVTTTLTLNPANAGTQIAGSACTSGTLAAGTCTLGPGRHIEFTATQAFTISANNPIAVAQFFPGEGPSVTATSLPPNGPQQGDPSMVLLPPIEQWRARYTVLASTGLKDNYLGLAIDGSKVADVKVDGVSVTGFTAIGTSTFKWKNVWVGTGTHTIEVAAQAGQTVVPGAGVTVYGYDSYVSYGYTGGLDLQTIVSGVVPGG